MVWQANRQWNKTRLGLAVLACDERALAALAMIKLHSLSDCQFDSDTQMRGYTQAEDDGRMKG